MNEEIDQALARIERLMLHAEAGDDPDLKKFCSIWNDALYDAKIAVKGVHESIECGNFHCASETKGYHCRLCTLFDDENDSWPCKYVNGESS